MQLFVQCFLGGVSTKQGMTSMMQGSTYSVPLPGVR
jgi:hypothetical protein